MLKRFARACCVLSLLFAGTTVSGKDGRHLEPPQAMPSSTTSSGSVNVPVASNQPCPDDNPCETGCGGRPIRIIQSRPVIEFRQTSACHSCGCQEAGCESRGWNCRRCFEKRCKHGAAPAAPAFYYPQAMPMMSYVPAIVPVQTYAMAAMPVMQSGFVGGYAAPGFASGGFAAVQQQVAVAQAPQQVAVAQAPQQVAVAPAPTANDLDARLLKILRAAANQAQSQGQSQAQPQNQAGAKSDCCAKFEQLEQRLEKLSQLTVINTKAIDNHEERLKKIEAVPAVKSELEKK